MDYFKKSTWSRGWGLRFNIGLTLSLVLTLVAFEWKSYNDSQIVSLGTLVKEDEQIIDIPRTIHTPPPPPKLVQPEIVVVPETEDLEKFDNIDFSSEANSHTVISAPIFIKKVEEPAEEEETEMIFSGLLEVNAEPEGGMEAFYKYISRNIKYPAQAKRMGIEGKVFVQFVVEKDGSLTDVKAVRGIGAGCDEEAERVVRDAKKWKPGKQRGRPVRQRMVIPIIFTLH